MSTLDPHLAQSCKDLADDLRSLLFFTCSAEKRLEQFQAHLISQPSFFRPETRELHLRLLSQPLQAYATLRQTLQETLNQHTTWKTLNQFQELLLLKKQVSDQLRNLQAVSAGILTATNWQSPSFNHSLISEAGQETGKILSSINDYKREHHPAGNAYQRSFVKEYIEAPWKAIMNAFVTSSGMSAFSTVVAFLQDALDKNSLILVGQDSYFENKRVLRQIFDARVRSVDEMDATALLQIVQDSQPGAIFLDTLCNATSMAMPDLERLLSELNRRVKKTTYLVLDNTSLSITYQPWLLAPGFFSRLRLIVIESLNKFHQFGFDRVTGGIIVTSFPTTTKFFRLRISLGTALPEASALALPEPNRHLLEQRLARMGRNALELAKTLEECIRSLPSTPFSAILYPGLASHPSQAWAAQKKFHGTFFALTLTSSRNAIALSEKFIHTLIAQAKKNHIDLIGGTSFGLDVTRVYLTARYGGADAQPFIRISAGTETALELEQLKCVFTDTLRLCSRSIFI